MKGAKSLPSAWTRPGELETLSPVRRAVEKARRCLLELQKADGHWVGELQGDAILESEWVLLMAFLGREAEQPCAKASAYILTQQMPEGGWSNYPGGPVELSVSVKAYFALKLTGHDGDAPYMRRARQVIRDHGGATACNSFTKFYLALLGQLPYANCPSVPPEMMLLPNWFYFNLYALSSWTRTIVVPLSIFSATRPVRHLPPEKSIRELFLRSPETPLWPAMPARRLLSWSNLFLGLDWLYKKCESLGLLHALRGRAIQRAAEWMCTHFEHSDGLGAIFPPMIYTVISLRCLGVPDDAPPMQWALGQLEELMIEERDTLRLQPCFSPVWDTALSLNALAEVTSRNDHPAVGRAIAWLLAREVRQPGDWTLTNPGLAPAGWFFEYRNAFYPDTDDTAMVLMALARTGHASTPEAKPAVERALRWLLALQNRDGGWAAFDRGIDREVLTKVPFADHNAMLDPSCPDITARVLEALGLYGYGIDYPHVQRALRFLRKTQEDSGSWIGRWGVNYLYGTWQVLAGLRSIGFDMDDPMVHRAVAWLEAVQQPQGAWGESCRSYDDPTWAGKGTPTASQTAWALLALIAAGQADSAAVRAGVEYLLATQGTDGNWDEEQFTGTGFPKVFYLKYHLYRLYFPLMALARYEKAAGSLPSLGTRPKNPVGYRFPAEDG